MDKPLKDISNITRKLVSTFPMVNPDDKENADPRQSNFKPKIIEEKIEAAPSEASSDGFEVNDDLQLDDATSSAGEEEEDDLNGTKILDKENEAVAPSPLVMSSLLSSRVVFKISDEEDEDNGASPMFAQQPPRQERRKLDFSNLDMTSPVTSIPASENNSSSQRRLYRRCLSMVERGQKLQLNTSAGSPDFSASTSRINNDMTSPLSRPFASFKRPNAPLQPLSTNVENPSKKIKRGLDSPQIAKPMLQLSLSESEANIKKACSLADVPNLTGDRSRPLSLPTVPGSGRAAKNMVNIDCHTMADLLNGKFEDKVASFRIIDARYCYEYKGGHIRGAENYGGWDEEAFFKEFLPKNLPPKKVNPDKDEKAHILIFHCEFSSARGPSLMALLRSRDRELNAETFPALYYPECYLLSQGYKEFYENYPDLCEPKAYVRMADPSFASEERKFHKKSRSWAPGGTISRTNSSSRLLKL